MASLIILRAEVNEKIGGQMRMVFVGATEAWLLAKELSEFKKSSIFGQANTESVLGEARVGVILTSLKPVAATWDERRILPGPPLTNQTALRMLLDNGVAVGIGVDHPQLALDTRFQLVQVCY
jgi:hypothetical protein